LLYDNIHDITFRRNVVVDITHNANIGMPGVKFENNTFYRLANQLSGISIGGSLSRGDASMTSLVNNVFLAGGSRADVAGDSSGFYGTGGASFSSEVVGIFVTNEGIGGTIANNIINDLRIGYLDSNNYPTNKFTSLSGSTKLVLSSTYLPYQNQIYQAITTALNNNRAVTTEDFAFLPSNISKSNLITELKQGYIDSNGKILIKGKAINNINDFVISESYLTYKDKLYQRFQETKSLDESIRNTFYADYNYVAGSQASGFSSKQSRNCDGTGMVIEFNFCELHGINGGDPKLQNINNPIGPDGIPFTLDDGLKPLPTSPLCAKGYGGADIGAYSCDPTKVLVGSSSYQPPQPPQSSYTLTVTKSGTGSGTITSNPSGINCGTDCTETYTSTTNVILTATPTTGSVFAGWSGACTGTGTCTITMNSNKTVTATFNPQQQPTPTPINGQCGPAAKTYTSTETFPQGSYCSAGTPNPTNPTNPSPGSSTTWTCQGQNGGNNANCSATRQSSTATATTSQPIYPIISNINISQITQNSATISWNTNEPTKSRVEYGKTTNYGTTTQLTTNYSTSHSITLQNLEPNTTYNFRIRVINQNNSETIVANRTFTTAPVPPSSSSTGGSSGGSSGSGGGSSSTTNSSNVSGGGSSSSSGSSGGSGSSVNAGEEVSTTIPTPPPIPTPTPTSTSTSTSTQITIPTPIPTLPLPRITKIETTRQLTLGSRGEDVKNLQKSLNELGFNVSQSGLGSSGQESNYFGIKTREALKKLQCQYQITCSGSSWGVLDNKTKDKINELLSQKTTTTTQNNTTPTPKPVDEATRQAIIKQIQAQIQLLLQQVNQLLIKLNELKQKTGR
jgi:hypothetical protein